MSGELEPHDVMATMPRAATQVFYDSGCPVCRREIGWYRKMAGAERVTWSDVLSADEDGLPPGHSRDQLLRRFTIVRGDGTVVSGGPAFIALWRALRPVAWLGRLLDRWPFVWLAEHAYRAFLSIRPLWHRPR